MLAGVIEKVGEVRLPKLRGGFSGLSYMIVGQQLSGAAADTIWSRVLALAGDERLTPESVVRLAEADLRGAGVSGAKIRSMKHLAERVLSGELDLDRFDVMSDDEVTAALTATWGIGKWTAEMYLVFVLQRLDVFPLTDRAIRRVFSAVYGIPEAELTPAMMVEKADTWKPWRTVASLCLYTYGDRFLKGGAISGG